MQRLMPLALAALAALSVPALPRAVTAPLGPLVQRLPKGEALARLVVERGLVADAPPATSPAPEACGAVRAWPPPEPRAVAGCEVAFCTARGGAQVCSCWEMWAEEAVFVLLEADGTRRVEPGLGLLGDDRFEVVEADLSGDGAPERVIAGLQVVSNGIPRYFWRLRLPGGAELPVADYGPSTFIRAGDRAGCELLGTDWVHGEDPWRGPGTYFVGQRWRLDGGALRPLGPPRARRLLRSFHTTPLWPAPAPHRGQPAEWLAVAEDWGQ